MLKLLKAAIKCLSCGQQWTADDSHFYDEMNYTEDDCDGCGKKFTVSVYTETSWTCSAPPQNSEEQSDERGLDRAADFNRRVSV